MLLRIEHYYQKRQQTQRLTGLFRSSINIGESKHSCGLFYLFPVKQTIILARIMKDYCEFPPQKYFTRVLKNCPRSAFLYMQLWKRKDKHDRVICAKREVRRDFLMSPTLFRNLLAPLMYLNILGFIEVDDKFQIDVLGTSSNE